METAIFVMSVLAFTFSFFTFFTVRGMIKIFKVFLDTILASMKGKQEHE